MFEIGNVHEIHCSYAEYHMIMVHVGVSMNSNTLMLYQHTKSEGDLIGKKFFN